MKEEILEALREYDAERKKEEKKIIAEAIHEYEAEKEAERKKAIEAEFDKENKYNEQVISIKRTKKTLGVDALLFTPNIKSGQPAFEMHAGYSRFKFSLLDNSTGKLNVLNFNVHADEVGLLKLRSEFAINYMMESKMKVSDLPATPAYTVKMASKEYNGKTPAQILAEDPSKKEALISTKKWLMDNLAKYPRNQEQIDAIDEALDLLDFGTLKNVEAASNIIEIYKADIKIPNAAKVNENGKTFVYSVSIVCDTGKDFPFAINIQNMYATPRKSPTGQITADLKSAENNVKSSLLLTTDEWYKIVNKMDKLVDCFEHTNYPHMMELVKAKSFFK